MLFRRLRARFRPALVRSDWQSYKDAKLEGGTQKRALSTLTGLTLGGMLRKGRAGALLCTAGKGSEQGLDPVRC